MSPARVRRPEPGTRVGPGGQWPTGPSPQPTHPSPGGGRDPARARCRGDSRHGDDARPRATRPAARSPVGRPADDPPPRSRPPPRRPVRLRTTPPSASSRRLRAAAADFAGRRRRGQRGGPRGRSPRPSSPVPLPRGSPLRRRRRRDLTFLGPAGADAVAARLRPADPALAGRRPGAGAGLAGRRSGRLRRRGDGRHCLARRRTCTPSNSAAGFPRGRDGPRWGRRPGSGRTGPHVRGACGGPGDADVPPRRALEGPRRAARRGRA